MSEGAQEDAPLRVTLTLEGSLVDAHRLPLSELQRVSSRLRATLRSIAIVLSDYGPSGQAGRVKKFIEDAIDLRVVGQPKAGSFRLELEAPPDGPREQEPLIAELGPALGERAVKALVSGTNALSDDIEQLPDGFDRGVLSSIVGFRQTLRRGVTGVVLAISDGSADEKKTTIDRERLDVAKRLVSRPIKAHTVVEGTLRMVDDATLECRLERPPFPSVTCFFDEKDRDLVWQAGERRQYVRVSGDGELFPGEDHPRRVWAQSVRVIYEAPPFDPELFWEHRELQSLAREQGVSTFKLAPTDDDWRDDDEAEALIAAIEGDE